MRQKSGPTQARVNFWRQGGGASTLCTLMFDFGILVLNRQYAALQSLYLDKSMKNPSNIKQMENN